MGSVNSNTFSLPDQPLGPPPPGLIPNLALLKSRASAVYIAASICLPLILLFAALRFYAKAVIMKRIRWDDATCVLGLFAAISFITTSVAAASGGVYGSPQREARVGPYTGEQLLLNLVTVAVGSPFLWLIKLALFHLYLEVFGLLRWLRYLVFAGTFVTGAFSVAAMVSSIVMCGPKDGQSQLSAPRCLWTSSVIVAIGVVNVISDFYLILIPLPAVWSLQLPRGRKIGVWAMFLAGSIACIASILGLAFRIKFATTTDKAKNVICVVITTFVEMTAGIMVCCMPATAAVFRKLKSPLLSFLVTYRRVIRVPSSSSTRMHEAASSYTNIRSPSEDHSHRRNYETIGSAPKTWPGTKNSRTEWLLEFEMDPTFPQENTGVSIEA